MRIQKPADLARIVKTQRQAHGYTQKEVADTVGITRQSLARIENGHGGASFETVLRIFEKLGIRLEATFSELDVNIGSGHDRPRHSPAAAGSINEDVDAPPSPATPIAAVFRDIKASELTSATYHNLSNSPIGAAASAATSHADASSSPNRLPTMLNGLIDQVREAAMRGGSDLNATELRQALLDSVIEAGDPDRWVQPPRLLSSLKKTQTLPTTQGFV